MRLFCKKCDKEIRNYILYPEYGGIENLFSFKIRVSCHSDVDEKIINAKLSLSFCTSDYGDLYFFEKERWKNDLKSDTVFELNEKFRKDKPAKEEKVWDPIECQELLNAMVRKFEDEKSITTFNRGFKDGRYPLTWTKDKPTKPGYYWRKVDKLSWITRIVPLIIDGITTEMLIHPLISKRNKKPKLEKVSKLSGEWAGPIPEPVDLNNILPGKMFYIEKDCCEMWKKAKKYFRVCPAFCPECGEKL